MKKKISSKLKKAGAFTLAMLTAGAASMAVYASVVYDSSSDPVVAYSAMKQYVTGELESIRTSIASFERRLEIVEMTGGGSGGSGSGVGMSSEALSKLLTRISTLESEYDELKKDNEALSSSLDSTRKELTSLISELQTEYDAVSTQISGISDEITSLQNQLSSVKSSVETLKTDFKQISSISTKLETVTYKVNSLTSANGDITKIKQELSTLTSQFDNLLEKAGTLYSPVFVKYGATVYANDSDDTVMIILRTGSAVAVSPFKTAGTLQGLNDLSDGSELYDGDSIPLFHNLLIPRGGDDGRGITVTSLDGAYIMIGGDYRIVEPQ